MYHLTYAEQKIIISFRYLAIKAICETHVNIKNLKHTFHLETTYQCDIQV